MSLVALRRAFRAYRKRVRPKVTMSGNNYQIGRRLLLDIVDILNAADIDYMVDGGTLIGLVREGDLLPWDDDIDISIPVRELPKVKQQFPEFRRRGWWISVRNMQSDYEDIWNLQDLRAIKLRNKRLFLFRGRVRADLNLKYKAGAEYFWHSMGCVCRSEGRFYDGFDLLQYAGRQVKVPANYNEYLTIKYGDWRTPDASYVPRVSDGTTVGSVHDLPK